MKLVIDLLGFKYGKSYGFQEYLLNLLDDFSESRDMIRAQHIILLINQSEYQFFYNRYSNTFEYKSYNCSGLFKRLFHETKIIRDLCLTANDVLLFVGNTMPFIRCKAHKILVIHDLLYRYGPYFSKSLYNFLFRLHRYIFVPYSIRNADKIIAISQFTRSEIIEAYHTYPDKIVPIYNYFNFEKYSQDNITDKSVINGKYILSICAKYKHKNHITILKAFEKFATNYPDYSLVIIGLLSEEAQRYMDMLPDEISNRVIVRQHLSNADIQKVYQNASLYVSSSLYEGLGMPVVEALYFGLPTLLSDIKVHHEVSLENAYFFDSLSDDDLSILFEKNIISKGQVDEDFKATLVQMYSRENTSMRYISVINSFMS